MLKVAALVAQLGERGCDLRRYLNVSSDRANDDAWMHRLDPSHKDVWRLNVEKLLRP
jgi:hypothetical protein